MSGTVEVASQKQFTGDIPNEPVMEISTLGEGCVLKRRKVVKFDYDKATEILQLSPFAGDRALTNEHVIKLQRAMQSGTFRWEQVQIITCKLNNLTYRMNGQHTSWARLECDEKMDVEVQILEYEARTDHDMRQLYASIDRNKARSNGNVVVSYLGGRQEFINFNKNLLKMLSQGLAFWLWEDRNTALLHSADDRAFLMLTEHYKLTLQVGNFFNSSRAPDLKHLRRRPVVSAMYASYNKAPEKSLEFWVAVRDGTQLSMGDPRLTLRNYLLTATIAAGGDIVSSDSKTVSSEEMFRACITCWNAWRAGSTLKIIRFDPEKDRTAVR